MTVSLSCSCQNRPTSKVVINEFSATNYGELKDDNGVYSDWIEFYNQSDDTVNLAGCYLTDDPKQPTKWMFPLYEIDMTQIFPHRFLLIFCGTDSSYIDARVGFKLDAKKGGIYLYDRDSTTLLDKIEYEKQYGGITYGRESDDLGHVGYLYPPSPEAPNPEKVRKDRSPKVKFSREGGRVNEKFTLTLETKGKEKIYFTTNGDIPWEDKELLYTQPLVIDSGVVIRARVIEEGEIPGPIETHTFIFGEHTKMPILSISTNPRHLFSTSRGLMIENNEEAPWEYPCNAEFFLPSDTCIFNDEFGLRLFGMFGKYATKKSFVLRCRDKYGKKSVNYKFFKDKDITKFDGFIFRADATYAIRRQPEERKKAGERLKNELMYHLNKQMGSPMTMQAYQPVIIYMNGRYFGLYTMLERKASDYIESNFGVKDAEIINPFFDEVNRGSLDDWRALENYIQTNDMQDPAVWDYIQKRINIPEFIDHWVLEVYTSKGDPGRNTRLWRENKEGSQWQSIPYDWDHWKDVDRNFLDIVISYDEYGRNSIFVYLMENPHFKQMFLNRMSDWLNTAFAYPNVSATLDTIYAETIEEQPRDREFWMSKGQEYVEVGEQLQWMKDYALERGFWLREQFKEVVGTGDARRIQLNTSTGTGSFQISTIKVDKFPWAGVYFQGTPFNLTAIPPQGYHFAGWSDPAFPNQPDIMVDLQNNLDLTAIFEAN
ncbi:MAG: CotH kinase family protein [Bacteroidia bacterium]|nr:CotH kinase family protein [Bacteroidia bacterium]